MLAREGLRPGIVCRGYRGRARTWPQQVRGDSDPTIVGDEAVLLARRAGCPVAAGPDRLDAARALVERAGCDVILSDDGLQHLRLTRDVEIAVVDGERRHGNGRCLPAGPLREPVSRLGSVDLVVSTGAAGPGELPTRSDFWCWFETNTFRTCERVDEPKFHCGASGRELSACLLPVSAAGVY